MEYGQVIEWLIKGSVVSSVLIILIFMLRLVIRKKVSPSIIYYMWLIVIIKLLVPYGPESSFSIYNFVDEKISIVGNNFITDVNEKNTDSIQEKTQIIIKSSSINTNSYLKEEVSNNTVELSKSEKISTKEIIFLIWMVIALLIAFYTVASYIGLIIKINRSKIKVPNNILDSLNYCINKMNIKRIPKLVITNTSTSPALMGLVKPKIIIPEVLIHKLDDTEFKYILFHELSHLKRGDIFITWINSFVKAIYWFNPLVYLAIKTMENDCEVSCDKNVLNYLEDKENISYGNTIINVLRYMSMPKYLSGTTTMVASKKTIKERVKVISINKKFTLGSIILGIVLIVSIAIVGLSSARSKSEMPQEVNSEEAQKFITEESQKTIEEIRRQLEKYFKDIENSNSMDLRAITTKEFLSSKENAAFEEYLYSCENLQLTDVVLVSEKSKSEMMVNIMYSHIGQGGYKVDSSFDNVVMVKEDSKWKIASIGARASKVTVELTGELKEPPSEFFSNYVSEKGYKIIMDGGWASQITLPNDFNSVIDGVKIGEILKNRNEISKSYGLDFTSYLGKDVLYKSFAIESSKGLSESIGLFYKGELIGFWPHNYDNKGESDNSTIAIKLQN